MIKRRIQWKEERVVGRKEVGKKAILRNRGTRGKGRKGTVRGGREAGSERRAKGMGTALVNCLLPSVLVAQWKRIPVPACP